MTAFQPAAFSRFGDVAVRLSVELGRAELPLREVLTLGEGSTVTLDRLTDELLDVTANGRVIARGEVVADKGRFALRIVSLVGEDGQDVPPAPAPTPAPGGAAPSPPPHAATPAVPEPAPSFAAAPEPAAAPPPPVDDDPFNLDELLK
ncbi:FliM/FliN family flagellar motor switch protein [Erythrobacter sp. NE805]|uniref:FliM/FliN family flagellar motor switch protein n=1 Tax=Erythrobacter sp. NE805 TaxID=3389875 RepID=UPI00396AF121